MAASEESVRYFMNPRPNDRSYDSGHFLTHFGVPFNVQVYNDRRDELIWPFSSHRLLRCLLIVPEIRSLFVEEFDSTLELRIDGLKRDKCRPLMYVASPVIRHSFLTLTRIWFVPEEYRDIFKTVVRFLTEIDEKGYCTQGFGLSNIVIKDGELNFFDIGLSRDRSIAGKARDFKYLHAIVLQIYAAYDQTYFPPEFRCWMSNLSNFTRGMENIMVHHVATLSHYERILFVREIYERRFESYPNFSKAAARILGTGVANVKWYSKVKDEDGLLVACFNKEYESDGMGNTWNRYVDSNYDEEIELLRFCRNFVAHCKENHLLVYPQTTVTDKLVDITLFFKFGEELCKFQHEAESYNLSSTYRYSKDMK